MKNIIIIVLLGLAIFLYLHKPEREKYLQKLYEFPLIARYLKLPAKTDDTTTISDKEEKEGTAPIDSLQKFFNITDTATRPTTDLPTEEFVSITFVTGGTIEGRIIKKTAASDYILELPGGQFTVSRDEIKEVRMLTGDAARELKAMIEGTPSFTQDQVKGTSTTLSSFDRPVQWGNDINSALKKAQQHNRLVMVDFSTTWCGWCKKLDKDTFQNRTVRQKLNEYFICVKIDGDRRKDLVRKYGVRGYPHIIFLNKSGSVVFRVQGYVPPDQFLKALDTALQKIR